ncbi:hypothetical protein GTA08_BOTSDO05522 [Botryosphaeria dothidea]|uniref:Glycosyltransferase family 31 protein n=1 Tax=Botryosphaeria dothidea TaxID=55169 RepID=A0A8H4IR31_9PEZI|nr:hypothetical protein GTA08_BOTSDO05522 [Botryosphaeria dothidea]
MVLKRPQWRRKAQFFITIAACLVLSLLILRQHIRHRHHISNLKPQQEAPKKTPRPHKQKKPYYATAQTPCASLPGASSVFVILKTGATEARAKLPAHLATTLRCIPHHAIYSDLADTLPDDAPIHDALASVPSAIKTREPDFHLYHAQRAWQASGLDIAALAANNSRVRADAWALDKWKFLPLVAHAHATAPAAVDWFLVVEADSALLWGNLLRWLATLDASERLYLGAQTWLGDDDEPFAHGGSGVLLSRPAVGALAEALAADGDMYSRLTGGSWAGDYVLGVALREVGVGLTGAWPLLQGETPWSLDYSGANWCRPVVSWHHMDEYWVRRMWEFERVWSAGGFEGLEERDGDGDEGGEEERMVKPIRHGDVFEHFVAPHILRVRERKNWDNLSPDLVVVGEDGVVIRDQKGCMRACKDMGDCLQWMWIADGTCRTDSVVRLGEKVEEADGEGVWMTSGWMGERIGWFVEDMGECEGEDWIEA